jgi:hypothetical protein
MCPSGFEQILAAAFAGPATDIQRALVHLLSMTATPSVIEAIRLCDQGTHINK